jgi:thiol-disulfide isomerase/thioredoxin
MVHKHVLGLIHAEWCGHCKGLKPKWEHIVNVWRTKHDIHIVDIEEQEMKTKLAELNRTYGTNVALQIGFPTIFLIHTSNKKVDYYNGKHEIKTIMKWVIDHTKKRHTLYGGGGNRTKQTRRTRKRRTCKNHR